MKTDKNPQVGAPDVLTGYRCLEPEVMHWVKELNRLTEGGFTIEDLIRAQHPPIQKRLGEEGGPVR